MVYSRDSTDEDFGTATIKFNTPAGVQIKKSFSTSGDYSLGERAIISYPPLNPDAARIKNIRELYTENFAFALLGLLFSFPWFVPLLNRFLPDFNSEQLQNTNTTYDIDMNFNHASDPLEQTVTFVKEYETFEFGDPASGPTASYSSREDIPEELLEQLQEMQVEFHESVVAPEGQKEFSYTTPDGEVKRCNRWEELPEDIRESFQQLLRDK